MEVKRTPLFARAPVHMLEFFLQQCYFVHPLVEEQGKGDHSTDPLNWLFGGGGRGTKSAQKEEIRNVLRSSIPGTPPDRGGGHQLAG